MRNFFKNLRLSHRLMLPNLIFLLVLAMAVYVAVHSSEIIQKASFHQKKIANLQSELRGFLMSVQQFVSGEINHEDLVKEEEGVQLSIRAVKEFDDGKLRELNNCLLKYEELNQKNASLEKEILKLSNYAIQQSDHYIAATVERLADESRRAEVTTLERLVIGGALINTVSNYKLQLHLQKVKQHVQAKVDAYAYLDGVLTNVDQDIERLSDTPFADLPKNSKSAILKIKKSFERLVSNLEHQGELKNAGYQNMDACMAMLDMINQKENNALFHRFEQYFRMIALFLIVSVVLAVCLNLLISRRISKKLITSITGIDLGATEVASASEQVSSVSQQLAEGSSEQAASIEETSASLEEISSMTRQNADNAGQADHLMNEVKQIVERADSSMEQLAGSMGEITRASEETSKIIKTIDEIAFQTNLLALNAAVEAARAGEAGAGFAVVADEVRNLAMRAADAAKNTNELIDGTTAKILEGSELADNTNKAFGEVAQSAGKVGELVSEIAAASNEQAQGIEQLNTAVSEMDKVTQGIAANAEESASASEEMNAQAEQTKAFVTDLVALVGGNGKNGQAAHARRQVREGSPSTGRSALEKVKALGVPAKNDGPRPEDDMPLDEDNHGNF